MQLVMRPTITQVIHISLPYETAGDLELLSLHRIRSRIGAMGVDSGVRDYLVKELADQNQAYIKETGKNWRCVTPNGLDSAVKGLEEYLKESVDRGIVTIDDTTQRKELKEALYPIINTNITTVKTWFSDNYDNILYDTTGKIPYSVVLELRKKFSKWVITKSNPFSEPIESVIGEAARSKGINPDNYDSYEDIWTALGGKLPKKKK
jgi:hypothetical protein